jgi:multicomponent Na+:H+ antiporter subunit D
VTLIVLPLAVVWIGAAVLTLLDGRRRLAGWLAVGILGANVAALVALGVRVTDEGRQELVTGNWPAGIGITLAADELGVLFAVLSSAVLLVALLYEVLGGVRTRTFPALVLFMASGLTGLFLTGDLFNFFVFFELSMIPAYVLSVYGEAREARRQIGAAFIFAVVNLLGSFIFLISVAATYHVTGTLDMQDAAVELAVVEPASVMLIAVGVFVAFGVKLGLFPFHFWLPPIYVGASPAVAAILSGALANIGAYGLLRFGAVLLPAELELGARALVVLGSVSILYGAMQALSRRDVREVLAYSAIGQAGYILVALAIGGRVGFFAAVVYAVVNSANKALLFLAAGLRGWLVGAAFVVGAFSVAGVPPSAGFFGKLAVFQAGVAEESIALLALLFVGGALSFVYMFQIYQHAFWRPQAATGDVSPPVLRGLTLGLAAVVVAIGIWPEPLLALSGGAADLLAGAAGGGAR